MKALQHHVQQKYPFSITKTLLRPIVYPWWKARGLIERLICEQPPHKPLIRVFLQLGATLVTLLFIAQALILPALL